MIGKGFANRQSDLQNVIKTLEESRVVAGTIEPILGENL